jgi:hypothetical protein
MRAPLRSAGFTLLEVVVALARRSGCPDSAPSPKKSPGSNTATIASLPEGDSTASFTSPF